MRVAQLREECGLHDVAIADCVEKSDFVCRLRQVRIWEEMSLECLRTECQERGVSTRSMAPGCAVREELEEALRAHVYGIVRSGGHMRSECASRGIPIDRLSPEHVASILNEVKRLEACKIAELKREHEKWSLILEVGMEKQDMVNQLRDILIWQALPQAELCKECDIKGIATQDLHSRAELAHEQLVLQLISATWTTNASKQSRYHHFFEQNTFPGGAEKQKQQQQQDDWAARAEANRQEFAKGNRNHAGMPGGSRRPESGGMPRPGQTRKPQQKPPQPLPPKMDSHFRTLGLPTAATQDEVRKAYRKLVLKYHPDKNSGPGKTEAEKVFREVQDAYDKLCEHLRQRSHT